MFEHRRDPLLPKAAFRRRVLRHATIMVGLGVGSLLVGVVGYHVFEGLPWIDALVNSSMLLGGMGPVDALHTTAGKLFASFYALFSGIVFLIAVGVMFAPFVHRLLHRFHLDTGRDEGDSQS